MSLTAQAGNVSLTASDSINHSSLNSAGNWSDGQPPSAGNDYFTSIFFLRTPPGGVGDVTFAGNSLTLQTPSGQNNPMRSLLYKGGGGEIITINNLTLNGAVIDSGAGNVSAPTFTGNAMTIAGNSSIRADQGSFIFGYPVFGSAALTNSGDSFSGGGGTGKTITYTGSLSGFTGLFIIANFNGGETVALGPGSSNVGNPAVFTPNQITIGPGCTLADNAGLLFTNSNSGITLLGAGNSTINASAITLIGEPITDVTNGVSSAAGLTVGGGGTLILSNANNNYSGGTTISGGTLQLGVDNAIPGNTIPGDVTDNSSLDLNGHNLTINGLNGTGLIDTTVAGSVTLTIGANGDSGNYSGTIQNSLGTLSITKVGAGTQTLSGGSLYSGTTTVSAGVLNLSSAAGVAPTPGSVVVSSGAAFGGDASSGTSLAVNDLTLSANSSLNLILNSAASGINVGGNLTLQDSVTNNFNYGSLSANPTAPAVNVAGSLSAPGATIYIAITASGIKTGTFPVIKYSGTALPNLANFQLIPPPGVAAALVNNTGNHSIDVQITAIPNQLEWNGAGGTSWDLTTPNWNNLAGGGNTVFRQYTNGLVVAGDGVLFDDNLTNDFVNPQPTNIVLNSTFFAFPVAFNSSLPYSITGTGGITGITSLVVSNSGSLALLTSNSFTGGVSINDTSTLIITNDSNLGLGLGNIAINGGTLDMVGAVTNSRAISVPVTSSIGVATNVTASLNGVISGAAPSLNIVGAGTLVLKGKETITGNVFVHSGTLVIDSGGSITNGSYQDVGQSGNDTGTMTLRGSGSFGTTSDFNVGDIDNSSGILNIQNSATLVCNAFFVGSANAAGSTASGVVNQSGGTLTEVSTGVGTFDIGGRTSTSGVGVYNISGGVLNANGGIRVGSTGIGTLNVNGGTVNAKAGINIARIGGSFGTNNLNGGTLATFNVGSSTGNNAVFNFNGGTLQAQFSPPNATWFAGGIQANVLAGGAVIDSSTNNATVAVGLIGTPGDGGLTKKGSGTLTLTGTNTFTGPITNTAGTLFLNSRSTYAGGAVVKAGTLQVTTASTITGGTTVNNNAVFGVNQVGSAAMNLGDLTLNGAASGSGATVALAPTTANNPAVPLLNVGTLTLNGTNSISLAAVNVGTMALIKYTGTAGSGNVTNLILPQGATGSISNGSDSTIYAVITSTGPGLVWTGTNTSALNVWNIGATTNWTINGTPTSYHQIVNPGDAVTFNDSGSGTVLLNTSVAPSAMTISNSSEAYTFSGSGNISGSASVLKLGDNTATLSLSNNTYLGNTVISNGTLQVATPTTISPSSDLIVGPSGTLELNGQNQTAGQLVGSGVVDNASGIPATLTIGSATTGTWNGTITNAGNGGMALHTVGTGALVIGGSNYLTDGQPFSDHVLIDGSTLIVTNGGLISIPNLEFRIADGNQINSSTSQVVVAGGTIIVTNNPLSVGINSNSASGTLIVNSGTVIAGTGGGGQFAESPNYIVVGASGATGLLVVNGGQVIDGQELWLGQNAGASGTLDLNGGLLAVAGIANSTTPDVSVANFNGGTLQAVTNNDTFLDPVVTYMIMSNGLVLNDGGFPVTIPAVLQAGDSFNGGLTKTGIGTVYLDAANTYTGKTTVANGTLAGSGSVAGAVTVSSTGNIGAGDASGPGTLTIASNLTLQGSTTMRIYRDVPISDVIADNTSVTYGGTLVISNISSTPLTTSDTFHLFTTPSHTGNFNNIVGSPGAGLAYSFNPANGVLSIVTSTIATNPTNITFSVSGGSLNLSWPADHAGWTLQSNSVNLAVPGDWFDYPPATGSRDTTQVTIPLTGVSSNTFFRLKSP
ncbi:MAG TPA: autotransporter-associated beta strand repeat-containing protein [Candidatus Angelobacter sp.]|nr:autotransporter-associated beta strand repeat-containing protein [Candidatus Angelobacter sp.]